MAEPKLSTIDPSRPEISPLSDELVIEKQEETSQAYVPSQRDLHTVAIVDERFQMGLEIRRPHEGQWFVNGSFFRGHQYVEWGGQDRGLVVPPAPRNRIRLVVNRIQPKIRARLAKFLKNRPVPVVIPATTDLDDRLDARATTKFLDYAWQALALEEAYGQALRWASITGHGYWWFSWDKSALGRVALKDPVSGKQQVFSLPVGDIHVEVGSPFEVVVADPTLSHIGDQPWIIRVKRRPLSYIKNRYSKRAPHVKPDGEELGSEGAGDRFAQQMGRLAANSTIGGAVTAPVESPGGVSKGEPYVLVKEFYEKPCPAYPRGRFVVVGGGCVLREQDELPYFSDFRINPYPCVDFVDIGIAGQYWGTTIIEQLVPLQRELNLVRSKLAEHLRLMVHPKIIATTAHALQPGVWTSDAGEIVITAFVPGLQPPTVWSPPAISSDVWKTFDQIKMEIEDIVQIFPESEGKVAGSTSGFQTNLLQEATDAVHGPDIRAHELRIQEGAYKLRRLAKLGYTPARLLTVTGKDYEPEAFEFHRDDIDENADIRVQAGSALPSLKAAKVQAVMEMFAQGLLGDPADPASRNKALSMMDVGMLDEAIDSTRKDEEMARRENEAFKEGRPVQPPEFFENHDVHYRVHADDLKSPSSRDRSPEAQQGQREHMIRHVAFVNPAAAMEHATRYGMQDLAMQIAQETMMAAQAGQILGGGQPPPQADGQAEEGQAPPAAAPPSGQV